MRPPKSAFHTWLQLLRAPNLFTVPGDPLAGFLLVSGGTFGIHAAGMMFASLCFYGYGLLLNDLADLEEDRRERPKRPLPSGAAKVGTVWMATGALAAAGLVPCLLHGTGSLLLGFILLAVIAVYNLWSKKIEVLGSCNMGLCRGLSFLLGAWAALPIGTASPGQLPAVAWVAAASLTLYIALVTNLARVETQAIPELLPRTLPFVGLILAVVPFFLVALDRAHLMAPSNTALYALSAYILYVGFKIHQKLVQEPAPRSPPVIGQLIRLLLPLQAIWCLASHSVTGWIAAIVLLALWPISRTVSRRFYAS